MENMVNNHRGRPSTLSRETIALIRDLHFKSGKNYVSIAKELGINKGSVYYWLGLGKIKPKMESRGVIHE